MEALSHKKIALAAVFILVILALVACGGQVAVDVEMNPTTKPAESEMESPEPVEEMDEPSDATETTPVEDAPPAGNAAGPTVYVISADESEVRYEVGETFINDNNRFAVAIGITQAIEGSVTIDPANPANSEVGPITIDISQFESDSSRRDEAIRNRWLESATYPIATFVPTEISGAPESYTEGEPLSFQVSGDLTIRDATVPTTFAVTASLADGKLTGTATTTILMTDFGFDPPEIAGVLFVENDPMLTFDFVAYPE